MRAKPENEHAAVENVVFQIQILSFTWGFKLFEILLYCQSPSDTDNCSRF